MCTDNLIKGRKVAHPFYSSGKWLSVRDAYLRTVHYMCEKCGKPAQQVHHREPLKDEDYYVNYEKCYGFKNLQALCRHCHNRMPGHFLSKTGKQLIADGYRVNMITGEIEVIPPIESQNTQIKKPLALAAVKLDEES